MALRTLILASNPREGGHYAKRAGLTRFTYRVVVNAGQVRGLPYNGLEVHILPSFSRARNQSSILAALRWKRGLEYSYVDPDDLPTLAELDGQAQAEHLGELDDETLETAYAEHAEFDHAGWEAAQQRAEIAAMSDDELAELLRKPADESTDTEKALQDTAVKDAVKASKPKPRRKPAAPTSADDFFGGE